MRPLASSVVWRCLSFLPSNAKSGAKAAGCVVGLRGSGSSGFRAAVHKDLVSWRGMSTIRAAAITTCGATRRLQSLFRLAARSHLLCRSVGRGPPDHHRRPSRFKSVRPPRRSAASARLFRYMNGGRWWREERVKSTLAASRIRLRQLSAGSSWKCQRRLETLARVAS